MNDHLRSSFSVQCTVTVLNQYKLPEWTVLTIISQVILILQPSGVSVPSLYKKLTIFLLDIVYKNHWDPWNRNSRGAFWQGLLWWDLNTSNRWPWSFYEGLKILSNKCGSKTWGKKMHITLSCLSMHIQNSSKRKTFFVYRIHMIKVWI